MADVPVPDADDPILAEQAGPHEVAWKRGVLGKGGSVVLRDDHDEAVGERADDGVRIQGGLGNRDAAGRKLDTLRSYAVTGGGRV
jgi:hypothetical protein